MKLREFDRVSDRTEQFSRNVIFIGAPWKLYKIESGVKVKSHVHR